MITNTRLLELRATGLACEKKVVMGKTGNATHLEKEYAALFHLLVSSDLITVEKHVNAFDLLRGK